MAQYHKQALCLLLALATAHCSNAVDLEVTNNAGASPGSARFDKEIGADYAKKTLSTGTDFIQKTFHQDNGADKKDIGKITLLVENIDGVSIASDNIIHLSANYIANYPGDNVKSEVTGVIYHELTHILQWDANGQAPSGLIEGIADYMRQKSGFVAEDWVTKGTGGSWDEGYGVTAQFLDYCESIKDGFVAALNEKLKTGYDESYFSELLGKPVNVLWSDYKSKYKM